MIGARRILGRDGAQAHDEFDPVSDGHFQFHDVFLRNQDDKATGRIRCCRDEHINPSDPLGSYAGAMGLPQFMPSNFRAYAVDFDHDNRRDIWHNSSDVIASIGNYFAKHHWQAGRAVAVPVTAKGEAHAPRLHPVGENYKSALNKDLKPNLSLSELESLNLIISRQLPLDSKVKLLSFEQQPQGEELWAALDNFYVITRYNHSPLYAMAVYQLSLSILNKKGSFP